MGKTIGEIANLGELQPIEIMLKLYSFTPAAGVVTFAICRKTTEELMCNDFVYTSSNGALCVHGEKKLHPRSFGTFPKKIGRYSTKNNALTLRDAICSMTSKPANLFNIKQRGLIKEGYYADLTMFNRDTIDESGSFLNPNQYPVGIHYVLINGEIVLNNTGLTNSIAGTIIYQI